MSYKTIVNGDEGSLVVFVLLFFVVLHFAFVVQLILLFFGLLNIPG